MRGRRNLPLEKNISLTIIDLPTNKCIRNGGVRSSVDAENLMRDSVWRNRIFIVSKYFPTNYL